LRRSSSDYLIAGVCGGLARWATSCPAVVGVTAAEHTARRG
jgi:phage shock protein PspC (stress-responsive transcriptional regulator)